MATASFIFGGVASENTHRSRHSTALSVRLMETKSSGAFLKTDPERLVRFY